MRPSGWPRSWRTPGPELGTVASDVLGASGRAMLDALVSGTHDPAVLAELAKGRLRPSCRRCGRHWRAASTPSCAAAGRAAGPSGLPRRGRRAAQPPGRPGGRPVLAAGGPVDHDPGVSQRTAEVILAEIGTDMGQVPPPGTWRAGRGSARPTTSRPASTARARPARAPDGCGSRSSRPPTPPPAARAPLLPARTPG